MRKMLEALGVGVFLCVCLCFCFKICDQRCTCHAGRFTLRHWRFHNIWTASMLRLRKCIWNFYRGLCKVVLGFACRWGFTLGCRWSFTLGRIFCVRAQCYRRTAALSASLAYWELFVWILLSCLPCFGQRAVWCAIVRHPAWWFSQRVLLWILHRRWVIYCAVVALIKLFLALVQRCFSAEPEVIVWLSLLMTFAGCIEFDCY